MLLLILVIGMNSLSGQTSPSVDNITVEPVNNSISLDVFTVETPIYIDGDTNFTDTAIARGWSGDGTGSAPFLIQNILINGDGSQDLITIQNTNMYFQIRDSSFNDSNKAIYLYFAPNGVITNNIITHSGIGLWIANSFNTTTTNNTISNTWDTAIYYDRSDNGTIDGNTLFDNYQGIYFERADYHLVTNNMISDSWTGFYASLSSYNNISHNTAWGNQEGIYLYSPWRTVIQANIVYDNDLGLFVGDSGQNLITENIAYNNVNGIHVDRQDRTANSRSNATYNQAWNNTEAGIQITFGDGMRIHHNTVYDNGIGMGFRFGLEHLVYDNLVYDNDIGMYLDSIDDYEITGHDLINNGFFIAYYLDNFIYHKLRSLGDNTVNGLPVYYSNHTTNEVITGNYGQILLVNSTFAQISDVMINNASIGVFLSDSVNTTVMNSNLSGNFAGVGVYTRSDNTSIIDVVTENGTMGIDISDSANVKVISSDIRLNEIGISIDSADGTVVFENNIHHNLEDGIRAISSSNMQIERNLVFYNGFNNPDINVNTNGITLNFFHLSGNFHTGIYIGSGIANTVLGNTLYSNRGFGVFLSGTGTLSSNNFILNNLAPVNPPVNATELPCEESCGQFYGSDPGSMGTNFVSHLPESYEDVDQDNLLDTPYYYSCNLDDEGVPESCQIDTASVPFENHHILTAPIISEVRVIDDVGVGEVEVLWAPSFDSATHDIIYEVWISSSRDRNDGDAFRFNSEDISELSHKIDTIGFSPGTYFVSVSATDGELFVFSEPIEITLNTVRVTGSTVTTITSTPPEDSTSGTQTGTDSDTGTTTTGTGPTTTSSTPLMMSFMLLGITITTILYRRKFTN